MSQDINMEYNRLGTHHGTFIFDLEFTLFQWRHIASPHKPLVFTAVLFWVAFIPEPTVAHQPPFRTCQIVPQSVPYKRGDTVCRVYTPLRFGVSASWPFLSLHVRFTIPLESGRETASAGTVPIYESHLYPFIINTTKGEETCQEQQLIMEHICSYESHIQHLSLYHYSPTMWADN